MQENEPGSFGSEKLKKIWGGAPNYTGFACKTGSRTVKISSRMHQNLLPYWEPKSIFFSGEGHSPLPGGEGDTPSPHSTPWRLRRSTSPTCAVVNWPLKSPATGLPLQWPCMSSANRWWCSPWWRKSSATSSAQWIKILGLSTDPCGTPNSNCPEWQRWRQRAMVKRFHRIELCKIAKEKGTR